MCQSAPRELHARFKYKKRVILKVESYRVPKEWQKVRFVFLQLQVEEVNTLWLSPQHRSVHCLPQLLQRPPQTGSWVDKWVFKSCLITDAHNWFQPIPLCSFLRSCLTLIALALSIFRTSIYVWYMSWLTGSAESCPHSWTQFFARIKPYSSNIL